MTEATRIRNIRRLGIDRKRSARFFQLVVVISLAHLLLGVLIYGAGTFAILHPALVFCVGMYWALDTRHRIERVALAMAYLVGAEVLWRMAHVPIYWEFGKYASALIAIAALVRRGHFTIPKLPLAYFALLIPACALTLTQIDLRTAQTTFSSVMSGPFLLVVCCWFFSFVKLSVAQLRQLFLAVIVPLFAVAFATLFFTVTSEEIQFTAESNFATSGGFGPNQVSAMLGLGAFLAVMCVQVFENATRYLLYFIFAATFFSAQSVLTFSRGGMYNALGAILIVAIIELRRPKAFARRFAPIMGVALLFLVVVFPILNSFTGGALGERFEDVSTANRADIAGTDLQVFAENPILGVGVGNSPAYRKKISERGSASHTEFARLASEHGLLGILAFVALVAMAISRVLKQRTILARAVFAGVAAWASLFMLNTGMRLAAPSFMWGLIFVTVAVPVRNFGKARPNTIAGNDPMPGSRSLTRVSSMERNIYDRES